MPETYAWRHATCPALFHIAHIEHQGTQDEYVHHLFSLSFTAIESLDGYDKANALVKAVPEDGTPVRVNMTLEVAT